MQTDPTPSAVRKRFVEVIGDGLSAELLVSPVEDLLASAAEGFRLYELFRLAAPDDLSDYCAVVVRCDENARPDWWNEGWRDEEGNLAIFGSPGLSPWVGGHGDHDRYRKRWDHSGAEWAGHEAARAHWGRVVELRERAMASDDELVRREVANILRFSHENDRLLAKGPWKRGISRRFRGRPERFYPREIYAFLEELLKSPVIEAVSYRGHGDWHLIRLACLEQIKRAGRFPSSEFEGFPIRLLIPGSGASLYDFDDGDLISLNPFPEWSAGCRFQHEGVQLDGLCIDDGGYGSRLLLLSEKEEARARVKVLLTRGPTDGSELPNTRAWFRWQGSDFVGVLSDVLAEIEPILTRHGAERVPATP